VSDARRLVVVDAGLLTTVQDLGRRGAGAFGVSPSGAADRFSACAANRLVGNPDGAAVMETTMTGASFDATAPMTVAVTGAQASLAVGGRPRSLWRTLHVAAGDRIAIGPATGGLRSYLAVRGGIAAREVLGSASTDVGGGFGGRRVVPGDALAIGGEEPLDPARAVFEYPRTAIPSTRGPLVLRSLAGPDSAVVGPDAIEALCSQTFRGSVRSSRQGLRLEGGPIGGGSGELISAGVCAGCVQLPGDGLPIVLLAEHQTTGGYPVALCVITADIGVAAQVKPGDDVRFERVDRATARDALALMSERLRSLLRAPSFEGADP
jgi:biotin-dependent carboxylase-like uncharacterized protein